MIEMEARYIGKTNRINTKGELIYLLIMIYTGHVLIYTTDDRFIPLEIYKGIKIKSPEKFRNFLKNLDEISYTVIENELIRDKRFKDILVTTVRNSKISNILK